MDMDLSAWLSAFTPLDETDDAFLRALVDDSPRSISGVGSLDASEQRAEDPTTPGTAVVCRPATDHDGREHAHQPWAKKSKKLRTWRAKDEIERLRRAAADLETLVALHRRRGAESRPMCDADSHASSDAGVTVWKSVAARELQRLRESQCENRRLRMQAQQQRAIAKNLARLIQRARLRGSPREIPRTPTPFDEAMFAYKRQELLAVVVGGAFHSLNYVANDSSSRQFGEEFRTTQTFVKPRDVHAQPGAALSLSRARRLVPLELSRLGDQLWMHSQEEDIERSPYKAQHVERSAQLYLVAYSFEFETEHGPALFRGMGARARFFSGSRDAIVTAGSFWPDASAPANVQSSGFDVRAWTVAQPHAASTGLNEVLFHAECSRIVAPSSSCAELTQPQATMLDELVASTQTYMLNKNDRLIDGVLLSPSRVALPAVWW